MARWTTEEVRQAEIRLEAILRRRHPEAFVSEAKVVRLLTGQRPTAEIVYLHPFCRTCGERRTCKHKVA